ncbi:MAG: chromosome partitioning protein ParB, partial [Acidobacteria bacterium]|nr:chromosome partitioning protein ParB [Acidobacteriota bacterium]
MIRMYRSLLEAGDPRRETDLGFEFEAAHFVTLGLLYEGKPRFSGGAFAPILRRVDAFLKVKLDRGYETRRERAAAVERADAVLTRRVAELKKRGVNHPYVK